MEEYFHAMHHAHVRDVALSTRDSKMGPVWWIEGTANYMAYTTHARLQHNGTTLRVWRNGDPIYNYTNAMLGQLRSAYEEFETVREGDSDCITMMSSGYSYGSPCEDFFYTGGMWAVALLLSRHHRRVLLEEYYPLLSRMDFAAAFYETFDETAGSFYDRFRAWFLTGAATYEATGTYDVALAVLPMP